MSIECGICECDLCGGYVFDCQCGKFVLDFGFDEFIGKVKINGYWYSGWYMICVVQIIYDGLICMVLLSVLIDMLGVDEIYQVCVISMCKVEFDCFEEFVGWQWFFYCRIMI